MVACHPFLVVRVTDARGREPGHGGDSRRSPGTRPERHDELLARQIDTPEKFLRLLALMLSLGAGRRRGWRTFPATAPEARGWHAGQLGVFETLVRALGTAPSVLGISRRWSSGSSDPRRAARSAGRVR